MSSRNLNSVAAETFFATRLELESFLKHKLAQLQKVEFSFDAPFAPFVKDCISTLVTICDIDLAELQQVDGSFEVLSLDENIACSRNLLPNSSIMSVMAS